MFMLHYAGRLRSLLLVLLVMLAMSHAHGAQPATDQAAPAADDSPSSRLIDLEFPGGTAAELINSLRKVSPDANIVVMPGGEEYLVPPMQLRRVTVSGVLQTLERTARRATGHGEVRVAPTGRPLVYAVRFEHAPVEESGGPAFTVRAISVAEVVGDAISAEDLLTALETALELASEEAVPPPAALRYHPETKLLIVRGNTTQIDIAHGIVEQLYVTAAHAREATSKTAGQEELRRECHRLRGELEALRAEAVQLRASREEAMLVRTHLEDRLRKTAEELDRCKVHTRELEHAYSALQRERLRPDGGDRSN